MQKPVCWLSFIHPMLPLLLLTIFLPIPIQSHSGLLNNGTIVTCLVPGCHYCPTNAYICSSCCYGYRLLTNSRCEYSACTRISKCSDCRSSSNICTFCQYGYGKNSVGGCSACVVANCEACGYDINRCEVCNNGYGRDSSGQCVTCSLGNPYCSVCNPMNVNWCQACSSGYQLVSTGGYNGYCRPVCSSNCYTCSQSATNCTGCYNNFFLNTTTRICQPCPARCSSCTSSTYCNGCLSGYYYNLTSRLCDILCQPRCRTCTTYTSYCTSCYPGYYYFSPYYQCYNCQTGCLNCNSNYCSLCSSSYFLNNSVSQCYIRCSSNCLTCQQYNSTSCTSCPTASYLNTTNRICYACVQYCHSCVNSVSCVTCSNGFFLTNDSLCQSNCDLGCLTCQGTQTNCTSCRQSKYLQTPTNICMNCIQNCLACTNSTNCQTCQNGYFLDSVSVPMQCQLICSTACYTCDTISTNCTSCSQTKYLSANTCYDCQRGCLDCTVGTSCNICSSGYYMNLSNVCVSSCDTNCRTCMQASYNCTSCFDRMYLRSIDNVCYPCPQLCTICSSVTACSQCITGYQVVNGSCQVICSISCTTCSILATNCTSCPNQKYLSINSTCQPCMYNCLNCTNATFCSQCQLGYLFNEVLLACQICPIFGCADCTFDAAADQYDCLQCFSGYYVVQGICSRNGCGMDTLTSYQCNNDLFIPFDGCDNLCNVTQDFVCTAPNSTNHTSACSFTGNLSLTLQQLTRVPNSNKITLTLHLQPPLNIFQLSTSDQIQAIFDFELSNAAITKFNFDKTTSMITIEADILDTITDDLYFFFKPGLGWSPQYFASINQTIVIALDKDKYNLCLISDSYFLFQKLISYACYSLIGLGWLSCIIGYFLKRLSGLQIMFVLQICQTCLLWLDLKNQIHLDSIMPLRYATGFSYNFLNTATKQKSTNPPYFQSFGLNKQLFVNNFNIMFGLQIISLIVVIVTYVRLRCFQKQKNIKRDGNSMDQSVESEHKAIIANYQLAQQTLFYIVVVNTIPLINYTIIFVSYSTHTDKISWVLLIASVILAAVSYTRFWFNPDLLSYFRYSFRIAPLASNHYFIVLAMMITSVALISNFTSQVYPGAIPIFLLLLYVIIYRPYKDTFQNIRAALNDLCILLFFGFYLWIHNNKVNEQNTCGDLTAQTVFLCLCAFAAILIIVSMVATFYYFYYYQYKLPKMQQSFNNEQKKFTDQMLKEMVRINPVEINGTIEEQLTIRGFINPKISLLEHSNRLKQLTSKRDCMQESACYQSLHRKDPPKKIKEPLSCKTAQFKQKDQTFQKPNQKNRGSSKKGKKPFKEQQAQKQQYKKKHEEKNEVHAVEQTIKEKKLAQKIIKEQNFYLNGEAAINYVKDQIKRERNEVDDAELEAYNVIKPF